ncbi:MAG: type IX secretion system outer membrane channel protein PorV [Bacteroidales bacterium]|nr:type IX secretion system outer membrane channel protein PorV [Bacteroidales bacterium]
MKKFRTILIAGTIALIGLSLNAQIEIRELIGSTGNAINTSVPFLTIAPDARSAGFGDAGVASTPDVNSQHWNVAKYAFIEKKSGIAISYTPWSRAILPNVHLFYLSGYFKINELNTISVSARQFTLGDISGFRPKESAIDVGYARKLSENWSAGATFRYIESKISEQEESLGTSYAADLGFYYQDQTMIGALPLDIALGLALSNAGTAISYTADASKIPIPTTIRMGGKVKYNMNEKHSLSLLLDASKLLVPTPPIIGLDSITGNETILFGREPSESILSGMIHSFNDAPGYEMTDGSRSVFREELSEIFFSTGLEYLYNNKYAIRTGYFHEHSRKGNRKYFTFGLGMKVRKFGFDVSYLLPVAKETYLKNTYRLMLSFEI